MGKKRRVLKSPKFANLRKHPKYARFSNSVAELDLKTDKAEEKEPLIEPPTPILDAVEEPSTLGAIPEPKLAVEAPVVEENFKPKPRKKRTTTRKKATARKRTFKKKVEVGETV